MGFNVYLGYAAALGTTIASAIVPQFQVSHSLAIKPMKHAAYDHVHHAVSSRATLTSSCLLAQKTPCENATHKEASNLQTILPEA